MQPAISGHRFTKVSLVFFISIVVAHFLLRQLRYTVFIGIDNYWPISIFLPKVPVWQDAITLIGLLLVFLTWLNCYRRRLSVVWLIGLGFFLIVGSNLLQGYQAGLISPIRGPEQGGDQYWQDADRIQSVPDLVRHYTVLQPTLEIHSRVHPPGAVLTIYYLRQIFHSPIWVSAVIALIGISGSWFLYDLFRARGQTETGYLVAALYLLLPAIQIYFWSTLDTVMATLFLATWWAYTKTGLRSVFITGLLLWLSSWLTFGAVILFPTLILADYLRHHFVKKSFQVIFIWLLVMIGVYVVTGYNYLDSFLVGKSYEGTTGFYGFELPLAYLVTRVEDVVEILIFLTPFLSYLLWHELRAINIKKLSKYPNLAGLLLPVALGGFFVAGAYYTGETARAAQFVYPFLMLLVGNFLAKQRPSLEQQQFLLIVVFAQSVLMQLFGWYAW